MSAAATGRNLRLLLAGTFVFTACAAAGVWSGVRGRISILPVTCLAAGLLSSALAAWLLAHHSTTATTAAGAELATLRVQHARMQARIEEFANSQGRFVGNIAHEIKTPLATVLSQTERLLRCSNDPDTVRGLARGIAEDMRHLADLVDSFLRLARPFAQEDKSQHASVYVHDFVVEAVARSQALAHASGVRIVPTLAESSNGDTELEVMGDPVLLEAMLENLVRNAVRFSPRGSQVELRVQVAGESILVSVRDHGTGVAAEHLDSVFDWFFRAPGLTLKSSGTGFGLAIARRVAAHHGGLIALRNHPEGGCEFEISLPRLRTGEEPTPLPGLAAV